MEHDDFFDWLATAVMDDEWENAPGFFREVICRKLVKEGKLQLNGDMYYLPEPESMVCPHCHGNKLTWDSDASAEECGYTNAGTVSFYHCKSCCADIEIFVAEEQEEEDGDCKDSES